MVMLMFVFLGACCFGATFACKQKSPASKLQIALSKKMSAHVAKMDGVQDNLPYRLYIPEKYDAKTSYPLIIWLHGAGERGRDNMGQLGNEVETIISSNVQNIQKTFVIAPQCPKEQFWTYSDWRSSGQFNNYSMEEYSKKYTEAAWLKLIHHEVEQLTKKYKIDKNRIYLMGFSMGGNGVWEMLVRYPNLFAASVPISGPGDPSKVSAISHIPIWIFQGTLDTVVPVQNMQEMSKALKAAGGNVKYTELNLEHVITKEVLSNNELFNWLFSNKKK